MHRIVIFIILLGATVVTLAGALAKTTLHPSADTSRIMAVQGNATTTLP